MAYLSIELDTFESMKKEGIEQSKEYSGEDEVTNATFLDYNGLRSEQQDIEFNERTGCLSFSHALSIEKGNTKTDFGYFSDQIEIDLETASSIVNYFMKKLGKLKTVLEATKE